MAALRHRRMTPLFSGNGAVVDTCQRTDVLLAGNVAVKQRNILDVRLIVLIADIAEQTGVFLLVFHAQSLDGVELAVERADKALIFLGCDGLEALDTGHIDVGGQNIVSVARSAVLPAAGQIEQLVRGGDLIAARRLVVYRRRALVACGQRPGGKHRQNQCCGYS